MIDYGDACATVKFEIRDALAQTANITGIVAGNGAEAIVEAVFARLHDPAVEWAFRTILDHRPGG